MSTTGAATSKYTRSSPGIHIHRAASGGNYTRIPNAVLRDSRLTPAELGVLCRLLSNADGRWHETADTLAPKMGGIGRDAMRKVWASLEVKGYVYREKIRNDDGSFSTVIHVYDEPQDHSKVKPYRQRAAGEMPADAWISSHRSDQAKGEFPQVAPKTENPNIGEPGFYKKNIYKNEQQKGRSADAALPDEPHIVVEEAPRTEKKVSCRGCNKTAQDCYDTSHTCPQKWFCDRCGGECYMTICDKCDGSPWVSEFGSDKEKAA